jgi:ATP synthase protein I
MAETPQQRMLRDVAAKQERMLRARREKKGNWTALTILGVVGWSVVAPTLAGIALGVWIDTRWPGRFSWTVILLVAGLVIGCLTAWRRIREDT